MKGSQITAQMRAARKVLRKPHITALRLNDLGLIALREVLAGIKTGFRYSVNADCWVRKDG